MRNSKAKAIKNKVYGDYSPRGRSYTRQIKKNKNGQMEYTGAILADDKRAYYQSMKKLFKKGVKF